jgi:hypothetical protein
VVGANRIMIGAPAADEAGADGLGAADVGAAEVAGAGAAEVAGAGAADVAGAGAEVAGAGGFAEGVGVGDGEEQLPRIKAAITRRATMIRADFFIFFLRLDFFLKTQVITYKCIEIDGLNEGTDYNYITAAKNSFQVLSSRTK